jgi:hypothetical protein
MRSAADAQHIITNNDRVTASLGKLAPPNTSATFAKVISQGVVGITALSQLPKPWLRQVFPAETHG